MTVIQTQTFRGEDELIELPVSNDVRRASVKLPGASTATSKLVLVDKMTSVKRPQPAPNQRILCTSRHYIASLVSTRTFPIIKIIDKDNIGNCTKIKDIKGQVVNIMFRNAPHPRASDSENRPDEVFAMISVIENTGQLWLSVYEIFLNDRGDLDNSNVTQLMLCNSVPQGREGITPVLAIQPSTPDCYIGVAVFDTVYFVTLEKGENGIEYKSVINFTLPVELTIVTLHIAVDESATLCACARDGTLVFYNPIENTMADPDGPFKLLGDDETESVNWIGFPDDSDDCEDSENSRVWTNLVAATDTSIIILSLTHWNITYRLDLILPDDQDLSGRMIYSLDDRGQFLVISSMNSHYLYVLQLITTRGHLAPDAFSRMFCYPMKSGLFDLSISHVIQEENIQGRYQDDSVVHTLFLIAVNNTAMLKCSVKFETGYNKTHNNPELQPPPRTTTEAPHQHDMSIAPAVKSLLSSSGATSPRPAAPPPMLLSPNSFTATPISITKLLPSIPTSAPAAPTLVSLSHDLPKKVPRSSSYQSAPTVSQSDELVPTPLATPAGRDDNMEEVSRHTSESDHELLDLIQRIIIPGSDSHAAEDFDAALYGSPLLLRATEDGKFLEELSEFQREQAERWPDLHPSVMNQILSKHLIMATSNPAVIGAICRELPNLGEDLSALLLSLVRKMFSSPSWRITLHKFTVVRDLVHELYQNSLPNAATTRNMMLQVFEGLVKSHFDVIDEEDQELLTDWDNFIRVNIGIFRDYVIEKDSTNSEFLIKLRDIIEPLKDLLPKEYGSLKGPSLSDGQNRLRMLMENSRMTPEPSSEGESDQAPGPYHQNYNTRLVSLLSYLDDTETVSLEEVCRLVLQVTAAADQEGMDSLAGAIVNNYYSKDWYRDVVDELCNSVLEVKSVLIASLSHKVSDWLSDQEESKNRNKKMPPKPPLVPALYRYTAGTSPLEFYIQSIEQEPLLNLMNTTLARLLGEPTNGDSGSPPTDHEAAIQQCRLVPSAGSLVACYRGYQDWVRGEVLSVYGGDDIRVQLMDYGQVIATNRACLRTLPTFRLVPGKAHLVRLQGVTCPEEHSDRVMQDFQNILRDEVLRVFPGVQANGFTHVGVKLSDGKNLAEVLSSRAHVVWTEHSLDSDAVFSVEDMKFSTDSLLKLMDESPSHHLNLVDAVKAIQKYRSNWSDLPPEVRDVLFLKARKVLGREVLEESTEKDVLDTEENVNSTTSPSTSNSIAAISSPDSVSPPQPSSPSRATPPPTAQFPPAEQEPASEQITSHTRPQSSSSSAASSKPHSPKPQPPSDIQNVIPSFRSLDIREKHQEREQGRPQSRGQFVDNGSSELRDIIVRLEKGIKHSEKSKDELDKKIDKLLQDVGYRGRGSQRGVDLQQDLSDCASLMYDKAYNIFQKNINQFYEEEVIKKLQHHLEEILVKQDQLSFTVNDKMKKSLQKNVTEIVKLVNDELQRSVAERLASDETLKNVIQGTLLPSFQQQLDYVYQSFNDTLQRELQHYAQMANQARSSSEADMLAHLDRMETVLDNYERAQNAASSSLCTNIESQLSRSVSDLYQRHGLNPPDRHR